MGLDARGRYQGTLKSTGLRPRVLDTLADRGVHVDPTLFAADRFAPR
jgi:pilus assembly protein CpaF